MSNKKRIIYYRHSIGQVLFFFLVTTAPGNAVVTHFIRIFRRCHNTQVILQLLLFQISLGKILKLTLGEAQFGRAGHGQLGAIARDHHIVGGELTSLARELDAIVQVLFELSHVKNFVVNGLCAVNDKFDNRFLGFDLKK